MTSEAGINVRARYPGPDQNPRGTKYPLLPGVHFFSGVLSDSLTLYPRADVFFISYWTPGGALLLVPVK